MTEHDWEQRGGTGWWYKACRTCGVLWDEQTGAMTARRTRMRSPEPASADCGEEVIRKVLGS